MNKKGIILIASSILLIVGNLIATEKELVEGQHLSAGIQAHDVIGKGEGSTSDFTDLGLGLFLHWSISSVKEMNISWPMIPGRVLARSEKLSPKELERVIEEKDFNLNGETWTITPNAYWALAQDFNPSSYDPDKWCKAAKEAGFSYIVLTVRHHDGFAMWPSEYGSFNTKNFMGGRDLIKPFIDACRKHGMKVGLYFSPPDWYHMREIHNFLYWRASRIYPDLSLDANLNQRKGNISQSKRRELHAENAKIIRGQITELLTNYGEIDVFWFDGSLPSDSISLEEIRELQPNIKMNNRGGEGGDFETFERHFPGRRPSGNVPAEFCDTWNGRWPHTTDPFRAPAWATGQLAKCRAWNMNFLLGIGPMASGDFSPEAYANIAKLAEWMKIHKESVLNGAVSLPSGEKANVAATANGNTRYLFAIHSFREPTENVADEQGSTGNFGRTPELQDPAKDLIMTLSGINKPSSVTLMRTDKALPHTYDAATQTLTLTLEASKRSDNTDVIKVSLN